MQNLYSGICSSSIYLFTVSNIDPQLEFVTIGTLLKGFKREIVEQRVAAGETLEEGKEAMWETRMIDEVFRVAAYVNISLNGGVDSPAKATWLYGAVEHLFKFPAGRHNTRRFSVMTLKTLYLDLQMRNKFKFVGDDEELG
jgi:hypothetical protein